MDCLVYFHSSLNGLHGAIQERTRGYLIFSGLGRLPEEKNARRDNRILELLKNREFSAYVQTVRISGVMTSVASFSELHDSADESTHRAGTA